jgi:hypothetical protein
VARTSQGIKVSLWERLVPLRGGLALASLEGLGEGRAYADVVSSCGGHPRGGGGRHWGRRGGRDGGKNRITSQLYINHGRCSDTFTLVSLF